MNSVAPYLPRFLDGFVVTIEITLASIGVFLVVALILGSARSSEYRVFRLPAGGLVEFFRGTSSVVQLFWAFYALPLLPLGIQLSPRTAAIAVLGLNAGSYGAEVVRGAIMAVPRGQLDASIALNLSPFRRLYRVIIPQALPMMLPSFGNLAVDLMKGSAIASFILVQDLTFWAEQTRSLVGHSLLIYSIVLAMYFGFAVVLGSIFRGLEAAMPLRRIERNTSLAQRRQVTKRAIAGLTSVLTSRG